MTASEIIPSTSGKYQKVYAGLIKEDGTIIDSGNPLDINLVAFSGTASDGSIALASADTWYAVPASAPTSDYILVVSLENADGTVRWSFNNGGTPSATNGNLAPNHLAIKVAKDTTLYFGSSTAGDDVNYTYVEQ